MENPAITAVIALYNGAEFIAAALDSVFAQTRPPARIVIVDDGSADDGPAIVQQIAAGRDVLLIRKPNGGQSSARNLGIARTATPLVALLDQDDVWYPRHLEALAAPFGEAGGPGLGWVYSNLDTIDRAGKLIARRHLDRFTRTEHPKRTLTGCLANDMFVVPSATLLSVAAFRHAGGFDEQLIGYEDDDLFLRLFRLGYGNAYIPEPLAQWRLHGTSASGSPNMLRSRLAYFRKLHDTLDERDGDGRSYADIYVAARLFKATVLDYVRALRDSDHAAQASTLDVLRELLPHAGPGLRLPGRVLLPFTNILRFPPLGRAAAKAAPAAWAVYKRASRAQ